MAGRLTGCLVLGQAYPCNVSHEKGAGTLLGPADAPPVHVMQNLS